MTVAEGRRHGNATQKKEYTCTNAHTYSPHKTHGKIEPPGIVGTFRNRFRMKIRTTAYKK